MLSESLKLTMNVLMLWTEQSAKQYLDGGVGNETGMPANKGTSGVLGQTRRRKQSSFSSSSLPIMGVSEGSIYLADPYFMQRDFDNTDDRIYSSLFGLTKGQSLRILCGQQNANAWLLKYPSILTNHVAIRSFTCKDNRGQDKSSFHDRYLITPDKEIIITHSINGWHDQGVTFATPPLWSLPCRGR